MQKRGECMPYISPESIANAKKMDLLTYLQNYELNELVYLGHNEYCTKTHDSLKISNGKWCWFSRGFGGRSALDYLIKVKDLSFVDAVILLEGKSAVEPTMSIIPKEKKLKRLLLPKKNYTNDIVTKYLLARGISKDIIDYCIKTEQIYESYPYNSVVFVGFDKDSKPRYAAVRGTNSSTYKGDAAGSDKHFSFTVSSKHENPCVHIFESAIDLLSYATIQQMNGYDWQSDNLLSLAGIYQPKKVIGESKIPSALSQYLNDHTHIKSIMLHLDNDFAGRLASAAIMTVLPTEYNTANSPTPQGKDYNDYLCLIKGIKTTQMTKNERSVTR